MEQSRKSGSMISKPTLFLTVLFFAFLAVVIPEAVWADAPGDVEGSEEAVCVVETEEIETDPCLQKVHDHVTVQSALFTRTESRKKYPFSFLIVIPVLPAPQLTVATCKCGDDLSWHSTFASRRVQPESLAVQSLPDQHVPVKSPSLVQLRTALLC